jgi:thymidine phosphorylase
MRMYDLIAKKRDGNELTKMKLNILFRGIQKK